MLGNFIYSKRRKREEKEAEGPTTTKNIKKIEQER
jgi:hypothetical protein